MSKFYRLLALAVISLSAGTALGAETGTLRGSVRDASNQQPLEGVTVSLEGPALPGGRTRTTDTRGNFWFPVLPPGEYRVTFVKDGFQSRAFDATVRLDQTTTLPPVDLNLLTFTSETIEVVESSPVIDNTRSAVGANVTEDYFDKIPVGRSYQAVIRTLPGVSGRIDYSGGGPSDGNPSVRGEGQYGNNYLLEGFSIRDPLLKTTGLDLPFDAMQEVSVFTDGAPAEFGNFTGMVANILLKSGSNETHGSVSYVLDAPLSFGTYEIMGQQEEKRRSFFQSPVITLGGPVVKDKLWFFSVADLSFGQTQLEGAEVPSKVAYDYLFLTRFTYSPFADSSTLLNFTVQKQGIKSENVGANAYTAEEATYNGFSDTLSLNANLKAVLSPYVVLEAKWNRSSDRFHTETVHGDLFAASHTDLYTGYTFGNTPYLYSTLRERQGFAVHLTRYLTEALGQHVFKGGYEFHKTLSQDEFKYTGGLGVEEDPAVQYIDLVEFDEQTGEISSITPYERIEYFNVGPLANTGNNNVLFVQDQWQPISSLTLNLGVRADSELLYANDGREVVDQWVFAPRFGLAWDVTKDSTNLVSANAGRYYDINGLNFAQWGNTKSSNYYISCPWDDSTQSYATGDACFVQDPVSNPLTYGSDLGAYYLDKFTLGYTRAIGSSLAVGLKGVLSTTRQLPEDAQQRPGVWAIENPDIKRRDYWAIELTAERQFSENWQVLASVTYSRSRGTSPGSFESGSGESSGGDGNAVGVFGDDIHDPYLRTANDYFLYGVYDFAGLGYGSYTDAFGVVHPGNDEGWYGYLPYHSFVTAKINGSYRFNWGTELGMVYEFDSGHAWQRRGLQDAYGAHYTFPEGRGVRFMPPVHYLDIRVAQEFVLRGNLKLAAELVALNVLDLKSAINYYENYNPSGDLEGNPEANASFGQVLYRQAPRALRANLKFSF